MELPLTDAFQVVPLYEYANTGDAEQLATHILDPLLTTLDTFVVPNTLLTFVPGTQFRPSLEVTITGTFVPVVPRTPTATYLALLTTAEGYGDQG